MVGPGGRSAHPAGISPDIAHKSSSIEHHLVIDTITFIRWTTSLAWHMPKTNP
jgi:hypothetical protein